MVFAIATALHGAPDASRAFAAAGDRELAFYNIHTKESITVTFKRNGRYIPSAMSELNRFFRDWRQNTETRMDPELFDLVWELTQELDAREPIHVISGYRSEKTNNMLRRAGRRVARRSMHVKGKAIDLYFPGVPLERLRNSALVREVGGVGYYPRSGTNGFVHVDTGRVRHWPRIGQQQMAAIFRNHRERTQHQREEQPTPVYLAQSSDGQDRAIALPPGAPMSERDFPLPLDKPVMMAEAAPETTEQPPAPSTVALAPTTPAAAPAQPTIVSASLTPATQNEAPVVFNPIVPGGTEAADTTTGRNLIFFPLAIMRREQPAASLAQNAAYTRTTLPTEEVVSIRGPVNEQLGDEVVIASVYEAAQAARQLTATELQRVASQIVNRDGKGGLQMSLHAQPVPTATDKDGMLNRPETIIDLLGGEDENRQAETEQPNVVMGIDAAVNAAGDIAGEQPLAVAFQ